MPTQPECKTPLPAPRLADALEVVPVRLKKPAIPKAATAPDHVLFVSDSQMLRRLGISGPQWLRASREYDRRGFPRPDPLTGLRYWPAIQAFFDRQFNVSSNYEPGGSAYDIQEDLSAFNTRRSAAGPRRAGA